MVGEPKKSEKNGGRNWWRDGMERKKHGEGVKYTQQNNKQKGQNARVQQQINTRAMAGGDCAASALVV